MISRAGEHLTSMADVDDRLRELGVRLSHAATEIADIDAELGGAGRLSDGIDPLGLLADVLELGRRLQWRVSLNAQCLRGLD